MSAPLSRCPLYVHYYVGPLVFFDVNHHKYIVLRFRSETMKDHFEGAIYTHINSKVYSRL